MTRIARAWLLVDSVVFIFISDRLSYDGKNTIHVNVLTDPDGFLIELNEFLD